MLQHSNRAQPDLMTVLCGAGIRRSFGMGPHRAAVGSPARARPCPDDDIQAARRGAQGRRRAFLGEEKQIAALTALSLVFSASFVFRVPRHGSNYCYCAALFWREIPRAPPPPNTSSPFGFRVYVCLALRSTRTPSLRILVPDPDSIRGSFARSMYVRNPTAARIPTRACMAP